MSRHRDEHLELCGGYALANLDDADRREIEAHLAEGCPACQAELERMGYGAWLMAASAPPLRAPASLRGRVLEAVRAERVAPRPMARTLPLRAPARRRTPVLTWAWAAAAALIAVAGVMTWRRAGDLESKLTAASDELTRLKAQLQEEKYWAELPAAPGAMVVRLEPTPAGSPALNARITYDPATRRAVVACENFAAPPGSDYQLWAILPSGPSSLGLVHADRAGRAVIRLADAGDPAGLAAFAVSLEKTGGSPTPNAPAGPVVMLGKIPG